jgi:hypothetical protein
VISIRSCRPSTLATKELKARKDPVASFVFYAFSRGLGADPMLTQILRAMNTSLKKSGDPSEALQRTSLGIVSKLDISAIGKTPAQR